MQERMEGQIDVRISMSLGGTCSFMFILINERSDAVC